MFQQTVLCHTTSQSKRREKGEQEKWKTSLQSKLFSEIVKIGRYFMYGDIILYQLNPFHLNQLSHCWWLTVSTFSGLTLITVKNNQENMLPCYLVTLLPCYLVTLLQYNTIQCSLFWEGRYMINPVKSFLTHGTL